MNKKLTILLVLVVAILAIVISSVAFAGPGKGQAKKVDICHFPGHAGDFGIGGDFPSQEATCEFLGGRELSVSAAGACNGHGITGACE